MRSALASRRATGKAGEFGEIMDPIAPAVFRVEPTVVFEHRVEFKDNRNRGV